MRLKGTPNMIMYIIVAVAMLGVISCGSDYEKTHGQLAIEDYYGDDTISPLIEPEELMAMLADPAIAPKIIIMDGNASSATSVTIPTAGTGARVVYLNPWTRPIRNDGPMTVNYAMTDGQTIDAQLRGWGVTKDSILVVTANWSASGASSNVAGLWWTLHYWGFSKKNLKVLNGGNHAYRALVGTTNMGRRTDPADYHASNFSVRDLPGDRIGLSPYSVGSARVSMPEVKDGVTSGDFVAGRKIIVSTLVNAMYTHFNDENGNPVTVNAYGNGFMGKIKGQKFMQAVNTTASNNYVTDNFTVADPAPTGAATNITYYKYKSFEAMRNVFVDRDKPGRVPLFPTDKSTRISMYCATGTNAVQFLFAINMAGYYNSALYANSGAEWFAMAAYQTGGDNATVAGTAKADTDPTNPFPGIDYPGELVTPPPPYAARNASGNSVNAMLDVPTQFLRYNESANNYSRFDKNSNYIDNIDLTPANSFVLGPYHGNMKWDMTKYSDYVIMLHNVDPATFTSTNYEYHYDYDGEGDEIHKEDVKYKYPESSSGGGGGPIIVDPTPPGC